MALIICKTCGKKISDTNESCIHCGALIAEEEPILQAQPEETLEEDVSPNKEDTPVTKHAFNNLSEEDRLVLEREFVSSDKWARNYLKHKEEGDKLFSPLFVYPILAVLAAIVIRIIDKNFFERKISNTDFSRIAIYMAIALSAVLVFSFAYSVFIRIKQKISNSKFIYMKKFDAWLTKNKNLTYIPPLENEKQKAIFESIDLTALKY